MPRGRFRYGDRWAAIRSLVIDARERAALEGRDRQIEDYVSGLAEGLDVLDASFPDELTPYTPTLAGVTLGDGTLVATYWDAPGPLMWMRGRFTLGATSAITGVITLTYPGGISVQEDSSILQVRFHDVAPGLTYTGRGVVRSDPAVSELLAMQSGGPYLVDSLTSSTAPHTWAVNDWFSFSGWIEPA